MSQIRVNNITNKTGIAGPTVAGIASVNSNSHFVVPTGRTGQRYADDGENIVRDGLVLYLDAKYSYPSKTGIGTTTSGAAALPGSSTDVDVYTWYDMSGNENHGELRNGVGYNAANGGSLVFDGTNDYVLVNANTTSIPYGSSPRTVSIWFYTNTTTWVDDANTLFFYGAGSTGSAFGIDTAAYPIMQIFTWGGTGRDLYFNTTYSQVGWKNITVTYDGATTILIYQNGIFIQTFTLSAACNTTTSDVYIGAINPTVLANGFFDAKIAQASIYNRALTASEVLQNFNATKSRFGL